MTNFARCFQIIIVTRALWSDMGVRPETDTLTPKFVSPQISRLGSHDKRPHWNTTLDLFEPWPIKKESSFFPPKQRTAESPQGRANRMLKPDFPKKGMGKEKWKEREGRNGKKEKKKRKRKIKKRTEERKEGFPIKNRKEVKREKKKFSINERKRTEILQSQIVTQNHSWLAIFHPTWTKRKRPKHPASSPKTLPSRKSYWSVIAHVIFWFDRKSCAK